MFDRQSPSLPVHHDPSGDKGRISYGDLHGRILEQFAPPSMVINEEYNIVHISERAGLYLQFPGGEISNNVFDLILPELRLQLTTAVYQAVERQTNVEAKNLSVNIAGRKETVNISVRPVLDQGNADAQGFIVVMFEQMPETEEMTEIVYASPEPVARQLEAELIRSKKQFRVALEQSEVQAEELKASNEELQAINEELRSTTEELETGKEELQSVNEELLTVNQELKVKIDELSQSNDDFLNLISSSGVGTIFLDRDMRIKLFTPAVREIFNLIQSDIGRDLSDMTHKLVNADLAADIKLVLAELQPVVREIESHDGRFYQMQVTPYRTFEEQISGTILSFVNITPIKRHEEELRLLNADIARQTALFHATLSSLTDHVYNLDAEGRFLYANSCSLIFGG